MFLQKPFFRYIFFSKPVGFHELAGNYFFNKHWQSLQGVRAGQALAKSLLHLVVIRG